MHGERPRRVSDEARRKKLFVALLPRSRWSLSGSGEPRRVGHPVMKRSEYDTEPGERRFNSAVNADTIRQRAIPPFRQHVSFALFGSRRPPGEPHQISGAFWAPAHAPLGIAQTVPTRTHWPCLVLAWSGPRHVCVFPTLVFADALASPLSARSALPVDDICTTRAATVSCCSCLVNPICYMLHMILRIHLREDRGQRRITNGERPRRVSDEARRK